MKKFLPILICIFFTIAQLQAQWVQTNGPYGGNIKCLAVSGKNIFAGTGGGLRGGGVFLSTDNCRTWAPVNNGLGWLPNVYAIAISGTNIFAGLNGGGVYLSTNNGSSWTGVNNGLPQYAFVSSLVVSGTSIFAGTIYNNGVYRSTNNGLSWTTVNNGLDSETVYYGINAMTVSGNNIFIGTQIDGIYRSSDNGENWTYCGFKDTTIYSLAISDTNIFAGIFPALTCSPSVFYSSNNGKSWNASIGVTGICNSLVVSGKNILAGTSTNGIFLSTDNGANWTQINNGLPTNYWVYSLAAFPNEIGGTNLLAGNNRGVYLSTDNGGSWNEADSGLTGIGNNSLAVIGNNIFAGTTSGIFLSTDDGSNWTSVNNGLSSYSVLDAEALAVSGTDFYAAIVPYGDPPYGNGICLSTDYGTNWTRLCSNAPGGGVASLAVGKNAAGGINLFAGTGNGIFVSTNNGVIWNKLNTGLPADSMLIKSIAVAGSTILAATNYNNSTVILSTDFGAHWSDATEFTPFPSISSITLYGLNILVAAYDGIYLSTNNGKTWTQINLGLPNNFMAQSFAVSNTNFFAGDYIGRVWRRPISEVLSNVWQENLTIKDNGNISHSLSFGQSSAATDSIDSNLGEAPLPPPAFGYDVRFHLPTGDDSWKDFRPSSEDSVEWTIKFQPGDGGYPITFSWDTTKLPQGSIFLKDVISGTLVSIDMKASTSYTLINTGINTLAITYISSQQSTPVELTSFAANLSDDKVNLSWVTATEKNNSGFEVQRSKDGTVYEKIGFVEGNGTTTEIHKYNFKDANPPTGKLYYKLKQIDYNGSVNYSNVIEVEQSTPTVFSLSQNFPNPFNPTTTIKYGLPSISNVRIKIYNSLGQEIETLVDGTQNAGYHEVTWDASNKASGIYFYSIEAASETGKGTFRSVKKLVLLK